MPKRLFDFIISVIGLCILLPAFVIIGITIVAESGSPVFFRQCRIGRFGQPFLIFKFRTMGQNAERGAHLTLSDDFRITKVGRWLRDRKLDELPQLLNVVRGDMSLVGPRPELPEYVAHYPAADKAKILSVRPGMTDGAAIHFRKESERLRAEEDWERVYLNEILPSKLAFYSAYVDEASLIGDVKLILRTIWILFLERE